MSPEHGPDLPKRLRFIAGLVTAPGLRWNLPVSGTTSPGMHGIPARGRLERLLPDYRSLPQGFLRVGQRFDGNYCGWIFSCACMEDGSKADFIPESVEPATRGRLRPRAPGGIHYVSRDMLCVDDGYLSCTDNVPPGDYQDLVELDFNPCLTGRNYR